MKNNRLRLVSFLLALVFPFVCNPLFALANTNISGGLPSAILWVSKSPLTEGDVVQILTPSYNAGTGKISGDVVFTVDEKSVGTAHFELASGESKILSTSWTAIVGTHTLKAHTENASEATLKEAIILSGNTTGEITVIVAPAPPKPVALQILGDATNALSSATSVALPLVGKVASAVFNQTEELRQSAVTALQDSLATNTGQTSSGSQGSVLGAETYRAPASGLLASVSSAESSGGAMRIFKQILLFLVSYEWVFYPLLIILILGSLYLVGKALSQKRGTRK